MMCNAYLSKIQKRQRDRHTKTSNIAPNYLEFDCDCANNREHKFLRVNVMSQSDFSAKVNGQTKIKKEANRWTKEPARE